MRPLLLKAGLLMASAALFCAGSDLSKDQLKQLQDPGGWDYIKISDNGIQTDHVCFDGQPHPDICSGRLTLSGDNKFVQEVSIQGQTVARNGTYRLEDDQLTFFDELETSDGPYTIELDVENKSLVMYTSQVRIELVLHKTLHDKKRRETK
jgi:hypothetical protein